MPQDPTTDVSSAVTSAVAADIVRAGRALARAGLVTAFGHVSVRLGGDAFAISPPCALDRFTDADVRTTSLSAPDLPPGTPKEAWIHREIYAARPQVQAICRAQPATTTALASTDVVIRPLHGQGSFLGSEVPVHDDSRLVRDRDSATRLADSLGDAPAVVMRGNGAVTVGEDLGAAVALMWVLEASAAMNATANAAGRVRPLPDEEQEAWRAVHTELLTRIWTHLTQEDDQ